MDRRDFLAGALGIAVPSRAAAAEDGRPPLDLVPQGPGRWRVRSWERSGGTWRPRIGHAVATAGAIAFRGRVAEADREALRARLAALA